MLKSVIYFSSVVIRGRKLGLLHDGKRRLSGNMSSQFVSGLISYLINSQFFELPNRNEFFNQRKSDNYSRNNIRRI